MRFKTALLMALGAPACSFGVVATTSTTSAGGPDTTWQFVGQVNGASGVAIGQRTILTAGHVGSGAFVLNGVTYGVQSAFHAPDVTVNGVTSHTDIELVNLTSDLPGWYDLASSTTVGSSLTMVGYGGSGVVNAAGNGYDVNISPNGTRRAGNNVLDDTQMVDPDEGVSLLSFLRHPGDAALAGQDSGGGWFDSSGHLIGISVFYFNNTDLGPTPSGDTAPPAKLPDYGFTNANPGWSFHNNQPGWTWDIDIAANTPYFGSGAIDVTNSTIQNWIHANAVPEPATVAALGLGLLALGRRRKPRA